MKEAGVVIVLETQFRTQIHWTVNNTLKEKKHAWRAENENHVPAMLGFQ
jgi:hypothetical protein